MRWERVVATRAVCPDDRSSASILPLLWALFRRVPIDKNDGENMDAADLPYPWLSLGFAKIPACDSTASLPQHRPFVLASASDYSFMISRGFKCLLLSMNLPLACCPRSSTWLLKTLVFFFFTFSTHWVLCSDMIAGKILWMGPQSRESSFACAYLYWSRKPALIVS